MKALGKGLFWVGFIVLMGVIMAYLIMMLIGSMAYITTAATLSVCAIILVGGLLMLLGRTYERKGEHKELLRATSAMTEKEETPQ